MCLVLHFWMGDRSVMCWGSLDYPRDPLWVTCTPCFNRWTWLVGKQFCLLRGTRGLEHWVYNAALGMGFSSVFDKLVKIPTNYKCVLLPSKSILFVWFKVFFLVLNAANVLNKKCSNESLNNPFLSSVFWSLKILQFIYGLVYSSYYNIFFLDSIILSTVWNLNWMKCEF